MIDMDLDEIVAEVSGTTVVCNNNNSTVNSQTISLAAALGSQANHVYAKRTDYHELRCSKAISNRINKILSMVDENGNPVSVVFTWAELRSIFSDTEIYDKNWSNTSNSWVSQAFEGRAMITGKRVGRYLNLDLQLLGN